MNCSTWNWKSDRRRLSSGSRRKAHPPPPRRRCHRTHSLVLKRSPARPSGEIPLERSDRSSRPSPPPASPRKEDTTHPTVSSAVQIESWPCSHLHSYPGKAGVTLQPPSLPATLSDEAVAMDQPTNEPSRPDGDRPRLQAQELRPRPKVSGRHRPSSASCRDGRGAVISSKVSSLTWIGPTRCYHAIRHEYRIFTLRVRSEGHCGPAVSYSPRHRIASPPGRHGESARVHGHR